MKNKYYPKFTFFVILFLIRLIAFAQDNTNASITFIQGDSSYKITSNSDHVSLARKPFAIRYFGKKYDADHSKFNAAQIAVLDDASDTAILKVGKETKDIPYFEPGTGMAPGTNGRYDTMIVSNTAHHYLMYEDETENRVSLISKNKDQLELEWKINAATYDGKDVSFSELKISTLYFVVFIDKNLNAKIDAGELKIVTVNFKN